LIALVALLWFLAGLTFGVLFDRAANLGGREEEHMKPLLMSLVIALLVSGCGAVTIESSREGLHPTAIPGLLTRSTATGYPQRVVSAPNGVRP
jgi:hypothetical protein